MAWYPEAVRKQLTVPNRAKPSGRIAMPSPVRINLHTAVSNSFSLAWYGAIDGSSTHRNGFFNTTGAGGVFSHFYVRKDGTVEQMQDTAYRSSCDLDGNPDTISVETWDGYRTGFPGYWATDSDVPPWNAAQVAALVKLVRWIYATHPSIPRKLATSNRKGYESRGLSYHRVGVPGYALYTQAEGGLYYTKSYKKGCPGNRRIAQIPDIHRAAIDGTPTPLEEDMPLTDSDIARVATAVWSAKWGTEDAGIRLARAASYTGPIAAVAAQVTALQAAAGVDVDEAALAAQMAALVAPVVRDAVLELVTAGGSPEAIADAVFERIGGAFNSLPKEEQA